MDISGEMDNCDWLNGANQNTMDDSRQLGLYFLSTGIGTVLFVVFSEFVFAFLPILPHKFTITWIIAYIASIWWTHDLNRYIVFTTPTPYWPSLIKTYMMYLYLLIPSIVLNEVMVEVLHMNYRLAWIIGLLFTGVTGYLITTWYILSNPVSLLIQIPTIDLLETQAIEVSPRKQL
jgi:putative flippase GtrA